MRPGSVAVAVAVFGAVLSLASDARADAKRDVAQEAQLDEALRATAPAAVESLHAGNEAMDRGDYAAAASAYRKVHDAAPGFVAGTRRLCSAEARSGNADAGVRHCREALKAEASAENHAALAAALVQLRPPSPDEIKEALAEATAAAALKPDADFAQLTLCEVAYGAGDHARLDQCAAKLMQIAPEAATTHYFATVDALVHGDTSVARDELAKAKERGLDPKLASTVLAQIETAEKLATAPPAQRVIAVTQAVLIGWAACLVLLLVAGSVLGGRVERAKPGPWLRRTYGAVVTAATLYFYLSLVVMILATVAAVGAFSYGALTFGRSTFVQAIVVCSVFVYAAIALARAMTTYDDERPLGAVVDLAKEPKLRDLLDEVAAAVGTKPVDAVHLVDGPSLEVVDRGGALAHLRENAERVLVLGTGSLGTETVRSLRERLAREHGKWRRNDAAAGSVALAMRRALRLGLEEHPGTLNPTRLLLAVWAGAYVRLSRGAVVEQKRLAELWAEQAYGPDAEPQDDDDDDAWTLFTDRGATEKLARTGGPMVSKVQAEDRDAEAKPKAKAKASARAKVRAKTDG